MGKEAHRNQEIQNILMVLGTAVLCAALLAFLFIYYYGPSGHYLAGHTILDPAIIEHMHAEDKFQKKGKNLHFIFDYIEFSYFDPQESQTYQQIIPMENYQKFYTLIASEKSIEHVTDKMKEFFLKLPPPTLIIHMHTVEGSQSFKNKISQIVQFVSEDYFRVQLYERNDQEEWAYFYKPHLYQEVMHLFTSAKNL